MTKDLKLFATVRAYTELCKTDLEDVMSKVEALDEADFYLPVYTAIYMHGQALVALREVIDRCQAAEDSDLIDEDPPFSEGDLEG